MRTKAKNAPMRLNSIPGSIEEIPGFGIAKTGDLCSAAQSMTVRVRPMPTLAAAIIVVLIPTVVLYLIFHKQITEGLSAGATKE